MESLKSDGSTYLDDFELVVVDDNDWFTLHPLELRMRGEVALRILQEWGLICA